MTSAKEEIQYEVITQEDTNGDLIIPIPIPLLKSLGWEEGDDITIDIDETGRLFLKKVYT